MLSLIIPVRDWPTDRIRACIRSFLRLKSKVLDEVIVVDFGSESPLKLAGFGKRVRVVRVPAKRWSLAEAINVGVMASRNPTVAKVDSDIVISPESRAGFDGAAAAIADAGGMAVVQAVDLPEGLDAKTALRSSTADLLRQGRLRPRWGQGGLCIFSVEAWDDIGGYDARFHGWGNEDNDFTDRIRRSGRNVRWVTDDTIRIFHVWHPPSYMAKDIVKARSENQKVFNDDRSTLRPIRFPSSRADKIAQANIIHGPRPLVTVAIASAPRKNRERMLGEAVRGFVGQIDDDFEVIVADNGSNDEERARLQTAIDRMARRVNVRAVHLDKPSIPAARNRLTDEARGRYICIADDDDIPLPSRLSDHLACFDRETGIHGSHGGWIDFDELTGYFEFNTGGHRTIATMLFGRGKVTAHPASFYRRDVLAAVRYDEAIRAGSDLDLALRVANLGCQIEHTGTYVTLRRFHETNVTLTDLAGQMTVGVESRQRIRETFGSAYEAALAEEGKQAPAIRCANGMASQRIISSMPSYAGTWRLLIPFAELERQRRLDRDWQSRRTAVNSSVSLAPEHPSAAVNLLEGNEADELAGPRAEEIMLASRTELADSAGVICDLVKGDVGVVDGGVNPGLYVVSDRIKGAARAIKLQREVEKRFGVGGELVSDVAYRRRRSTRFDWSKLRDEAASQRLVSRPSTELDGVLTALATIPEGTMLRAMTSFVADFNCEDQLFHILTTPIRGGQALADVKRALERHTGEPFEVLAEAMPQLTQGAQS